MVRSWLDSWAGVGHVIEAMHETGYKRAPQRSPFCRWAKFRRDGVTPVSRCIGRAHDAAPWHAAKSVAPHHVGARPNPSLGDQGDEPPTEVRVSLTTEPGLARPDLQGFFLPYCLTEAPLEAFQPYCHGISFAFYVTRPASRGRIALASRDPLDPPLIDPNYLSEPDDLARLVAGLRTVRDIFAAKPLGALLGRELSPGRDAQTDAELGAVVRDRASGTIFHPVGTCAMGAHDQAVVDATLAVRGLESLRVVDASVMPTLIGGNTNAPTIMIAEKASAMILA